MDTQKNSKELSQCDGSFEHPKHMLETIGKKIFTIYAGKFCLSKPEKNVYLNMIMNTTL